MTKDGNIIKYLLFEGPLSPEEIIKGLGIPKSTTFLAIKRLTKSGIIEKAYDDFTPGRRVSYRVIPTMIPQSIGAEIRLSLKYVGWAIAEFSRAKRPEHTRFARAFLDSGILTIREIKILAGIYDENWEKFILPDEMDN